MPRTLTDPTRLPTGTATFLFTDIEGSTRLVQQVSSGEWTELLDRHRRVMRAAFAAHEGVEVMTEGDAFFVAFAAAGEAVAACAEAQRGLYAEAWPEGREVRVRMGLHTGEARLVGDDYEGIDIHRAARVMSAGHGAQVLLSETTRGLVEANLPQGTRLRDLGNHRLKDLLREVHLYQLDIEGLRDEFPPLKSLDFTPNNLPTQLTSFVGREAELADARRLLEGTRLLTLTGPGGTGKTRLSLQLAAEASEDYPDGVFWVALAPISDRALVASTIAQVLGLQEAGAATALELVTRHLASRRALLVLDNFEQVIDAAPDVSDVLRAAPSVKAVATSRAPLRIYGEQEYAVPPLGVPDIDHLPALQSLSHYAAVRLFIDRAIGIKADFQVTNENAPAVAGIAALVDGLPLAIELAASRIRLLPPRAILERLQRSLAELGGGARDLPARQQTLHGAIQWSYELLPEGVRRLMARLAVFRRGVALSCAEAVCGPDQEIDMTVLDGLEMLVEQSLLRTAEGDEEPRFFMLYVIREFALERLKEGGEGATIRRRHADIFLRLAEEAAPNYTGSDPKRWLDRAELEHDNLRAALDWLVEERDAEGAMRLASAMWRFWQMRGHLREGRERVEQALQMPGTNDHPHCRMKTLEAAGGLAWWQGDIESCARFYQAALDEARRLEDGIEIAGALYNLAFTMGRDPKRVDEAINCFREARLLYENVNDLSGATRTRWGELLMLQERKQFESAYTLAREVTDTFRRLDQRFDLAWALHQLAMAAVHMERVDEAFAATVEATEILLGLKDTSGIPILLGDFSDVALASGDRERAMRLRGASAAIQEQTGAGLESSVAGVYNYRFEVEPDEAERERLERAFAEGRALAQEEAIAYALGRAPATDIT